MHCLVKDRVLHSINQIGPAYYDCWFVDIRVVVVQAYIDHWIKSRGHILASSPQTFLSKWQLGYLPNCCSPRFSTYNLESALLTSLLASAYATFYLLPLFA